jgi:hypothetical protein
MMFRHRHPLHALQGLHHVVGVAQQIGRQAHRIGARVPRDLIVPRSIPVRTPAVAHVLLAGLAVLAFAGVMSRANRSRSRAGRVALGALLLALAVVVLWLRRSGRRYRL